MDFHHPCHLSELGAPRLVLNGTNQLRVADDINYIRLREVFLYLAGDSRCVLRQSNWFGTTGLTESNLAVAALTA
jgi:hypothetical protein